MAALHRPFSIGTEGDLLSSDPADYAYEPCRKHYSRPSSSSNRNASRSLSSPRRQAEASIDPRADAWTGWPAYTGTSKMQTGPQAHYDHGAAYPGSGAVLAHRTANQTRPAVEGRSIGSQADSGYADSHAPPKPPSPPPAPPMPAAPSSARHDAGSNTLASFGLDVPATTAAATDLTPKRPVPIWEWCANMVCYIWFAGVATPEASPAPPSATTATPCRSPTAFNAPLQSSPLANRRHRKSDSLGSLSECSKFSAHDLSQAVEAHLRASADPVRSPSSVAADSRRDPLSLRLSARHRFKLFVKDLLSTTQVSKSVILLALLYIHRLKSRHPGLRGEEGSEFRLFITALMLGNKFLDDHTYTNKTWAELSGIELKDITRMEVEFWLGLSMSIYVSDVDFRHWIKTLEQLAQRRQQALIRREMEAARRSAIRQQQRLQRRQQQQLQQQQQQLQRQQSFSRQLQCSRASPSLPWSPHAAYHSDGGASPNRSGPMPTFAPLLFSPSSQPVDPVDPRRTPTDAACPVYPALPAVDGLGALSGHTQYDYRLLSPDRDDYLTGRRPSGATKRSLAAVHGSEPACAYSSPSPERPRKRMAALEPAYSMERSQRTSLSPCGQPVAPCYPEGDPSAQAAACGVSPISNQPFPRSVFEPLVTTPNTLLAPYISHQTAAQAQQHRQHPLAYWQLAAGHDRGILGVHLPAPRPSSSGEYYGPALADSGRRGSIGFAVGTPPHNRLARHGANTATAYYPSSDPAQPIASAGYASVVPSKHLVLDAVDADQARRGNGPTTLPPLASSAGMSGGTVPHHHLQDPHLHAIQPAQQLYAAPHVPFNNAEGSYVDPFARFL
ncbi:uncharacterized protein PFL1_05129 [Pseudozyma flocculosa PF-1]|uniref:Cyclin N-terminal domain-containing protein n=2 Tax=Pseudozyma flocculosa TaxID=84751 RepID=A0A5C3F828_9BASI|nr:uncharacterized protein PFL1_05129 [Pseudozyma flocculosa PF-1]EPQ27206.1 hypothetical protein PFL1_05129 [Pseudozyma flocculosa PF-1]SPO39569.1 uncharacterized protein PSFLO_05050 [Pseudozyma flocculosa]